MDKLSSNEIIILCIIILIAVCAMFSIIFFPLCNQSNNWCKKNKEDQACITTIGHLNGLYNANNTCVCLTNNKGFGTLGIMNNTPGVPAESVENYSCLCDSIRCNDIVKNCFGSNCYASLCTNNYSYSTVVPGICSNKSCKYSNICKNAGLVTVSTKPVQYQ